MAQLLPLPVLVNLAAALSRMQRNSLILLRARLDLFVAVVAIPAVESAHEGGPVPCQCRKSHPLLLGRLAAVPNQTRRVSWRSRLVRLAMAQLVAAGLVRALLDILLHPTAVAEQMAAVVLLPLIVGRAASIQTQTFPLASCDGRQSWHLRWSLWPCHLTTNSFG